MREREMAAQAAVLSLVSAAAAAAGASLRLSLRLSTVYQAWNSIFLSQQISHSRLIS
jgi:hypothetical protein